MKFPLDLVARVRSSLDRVGYCFLSSDEIQRVLAHTHGGWQGKHDALKEFAVRCGARVETTPHLKSARFTPVAASERDQIQQLESGFVPPCTAMA